MTASSSLIRWSGLAAMLGGLLWIVPIAITAIKPEHSRRGPEGFAVLLLLAALVLIGVGVLGIYLRQRGGSGPLGTIAVLVASLGIVIMVPGRLLEPAIFFQAGRLIFLAGLVLFVIDMFVANMMPRGATLLLVIGTLALALFNFGDERIWIGVLFGAAWIWLGYALWSGRVRRPSSPRMRDEERRRSLMSSKPIHWSGLAAMLGGVLWIIGAVIHASKPRGCVAEECAFRPMRESGALDGILTLLSLLLFAVGVAGLVVLVRSAGRFGMVGKAGVVIGAAGATLLVTVSLVQSVFFGGDFLLMPYFVIPGLLALVIGLVLLGVAILRSGVLPRWAAALLIIGSLAMLGSNEQTARVLLTIPLGVAWIAVGYMLWSDSDESAQQPARVR